MSATSMTTLLEAVSALGEVWADAETPADLERGQLVASTKAIGVVRRVLDGLQAGVAAQIAHESRAELGPESLAKQQGFRNPAAFIATTTGTSTGDAARLVKVGEATTVRRDLLGAALPAKYPAVQAALGGGRLAAQAAGLIISFLDRVRLGRDKTMIADVERRLAERAVGLSIDDVRRLITRAEAELETDRLQAREEERRAQRSLTMYERDGMLNLHYVAPVEDSAHILTAINGNVTAQFAVKKEAEAAGKVLEGAEDLRTVAQRRADALQTICGHAAACDNDRVPMAGATVIVRVDAADLEAGAGAGSIDGVDQPISIAAVRRMAAGQGVIPCVLDSDSEVLDWGRERRLFTPAQKLALADRDGGCAMCGLPPGMTKVHHIRWWRRDTGPTDLTNGVLLCETCHHRIHDNGWDVHIDGTGMHARVWLIPPSTIDPTRTPRLGGRARYDITA